MPPPVDQRLLQVTAPHFCAGAVWQKREGKWVCVQAAPILKWMVGLSAETMKQRQPGMLRKGWTFVWV